MTNKNTPLPSTSKIPTKWLAVAIFVLVGYGLTQPFVNRKFGWTLPSLASVLGFEDKAAKEKQAAASDSNNDEAGSQKQSGGSNRSSADKSKGKQSSDPQSDEALTAEQLESQLLGEPEVVEKNTTDKNNKSSTDSTSSKTGSKTEAESPSKKPTKQETSSSTTSTKSTKSSSNSDEKLLYGLLKEVGREEYVSPAGLRYTRGSEEGHRLKHLERHLSDMPDRPGRHGVFEGDMAAFLRLLDEAYTRAEKGEKGTSKTEDEEGMMKYEVTLPKPIGFIGGRDGAKQKNPDAKRIRMILAGDRVITAFPF